VEDHGYILDLGVPDVSGFLSFDDAKKGPFKPSAKLPVGALVEAVVIKMSKNGRTCNISVDPAAFAASSVRQFHLLARIVRVLTTNIVVRSYQCHLYSSR
jgi:rRNA biogenesis protein RRP5